VWPVFDAILLIAFGGPQGRDDVRPFLANVLRGRRVAPERVDEVARHYELFDGVSPLTALTMRQARALEARLAGRGAALPVFVGMRNWHPYLADTLAEMQARGVRRAVGVIMAAHRSYSSCQQYRENVRDARAELVRRTGRDVDVVYVGDWHTHDGFVEAGAARVREARARLPAAVRDAARLVFTAHSIPAPAATAFPYDRQLRESAAAIAGRVGAAQWTLVYQSRSGRPEDPWLGPDVCEYLRADASSMRAAILCPVGFLCDHVEVLYDLDREAADLARELGLPMVRAATVGDHPAFIDTLAGAVTDVVSRYSPGLPLPIAWPERAR
jgi:ferrochelatase